MASIIYWSLLCCYSSQQNGSIVQSWAQVCVCIELLPEWLLFQQAPLLTVYLSIVVGIRALTVYVHTANTPKCSLWQNRMYNRCIHNQSYRCDLCLESIYLDDQCELVFAGGADTHTAAALSEGQLCTERAQTGGQQSCWQRNIYSQWAFSVCAHLTVLHTRSQISANLAEWLISLHHYRCTCMLWFHVNKLSTCIIYQLYKHIATCITY